MPGIIKKENLLKDKYPKVFSQVHPTKNNGINVNELTLYIKKKIWWKCINKECNSSWERGVQSMCNVYGGNGVECKKCQSIGTKFPDLTKEIDLEKQPDIDIFNLYHGSSKKIWWKCLKHKECEHHRWEAKVYSRTKDNSGCPFCSKFKTCYCRSFGNLYPNIAKEIDLEKHPNLDINAICAHSSQSFWWKCSKHKECDHHRWKSTINCRTQFNRGCPFCLNQKVCECTSLGTLYPNIAKELDRNKHPNIDVYSINASSNVKYWWKCSICNYNWENAVSQRTVQNVRCPSCATKNLEKICRDILVDKNISFEREKHFKGCIDKGKLRFDFYLPIHQACIEIDGKQHFQYRSLFEVSLETYQKRDNIKNNYCKNNDIHLLRVSYSEMKHFEKHLATFLATIDQCDETNGIVFICFGKEYTI